MKTDDYIKNLSADLKVQTGPGFYSTTIAAWFAGSLAVLGLSFFIMPTREDLAPVLQSIMFNTETAVCFAVFVGSAWVAFLSVVPSVLHRRERFVVAAFLMLLIAFLFSKVEAAGMGQEFTGEMDFYRGRCGPIILIIGLLETAFAMTLLKRGAPTNPARTGAWLALSSGGLGLFVMQFICAHDNFMHLAIWHAAPLGILVAAGALAGQKLLRW